MLKLKMSLIHPEDNINTNWFPNIFSNKNNIKHKNKIKPMCKSETTLHTIKTNIPIIKFPKIAGELEINELEPQSKKQKNHL